MKRARLFFTVIRVPLDYVMLLLAAFLTYFIRFESLRTVRPVIYEIPLREYTDVIGWIAAGWVAIFALHGLYRTRRPRLMEELARIIFGCATGFVAIMIYLVFRQELFSSRFILLGTFLLAILCITIGRLVLRGFERAALAYGVGIEHLALIGSPQSRHALRHEFESKRNLGFRVAAEFDHLTEKAAEDIKTLKKNNRLDGIVLTDSAASREESLRTIDCAEELHVRFFYSADLFAAATTNIAIHTFAGLPVIELKRTSLDGWGRVAKRTFDIIGSTMLLILTSPLILLSALLVLVETGVPIIFKNERYGEHGRTFDALKFRSMYQKFSVGKQFPDHEHALVYEQQLIEERSDKKEGVYKIKDDPRVTAVGKFLRRWSLDELPQLWNVLAGDMSLVGPRPHQPREVGEYAQYHRHVLAIKPGITGLAQISGRSDLSFLEEIRLDTYYVENWSLGLDVFILLKTPFVVLLKKGAY